MRIVMTAADENAALRALEIDFDLARSEGRATLERLNGPAAPAVPRVDTAAKQEQPA